MRSVSVVSDGHWLRRLAIVAMACCGLLSGVSAALAAAADDPPIVIEDDARIDLNQLRLSSKLSRVKPGSTAAGAAEKPGSGSDGPWWRKLTGTPSKSEGAAATQTESRPGGSSAKFQEADTGRGGQTDSYTQQVSGGFELLKTLFLVGITFVCVLFIWEWLRSRSVGEYQEVALAGGGASRGSSRPVTPRRPQVPGVRRPQPAVRRVPSAMPVNPPPRSVQKVDEPVSPVNRRGRAEEAFDDNDDTSAAKSNGGAAITPGADNWDNWVHAGSVGWGGYDTAETYDPEADDPLSAANLYMSFGLHDQAASLLLEKTAAFPKRTDLRVALLQAYYNVNNDRAFMRHFGDLLKSSLTISDGAWQDIARWGSALLPREPIFSLENAQQARESYKDPL